MSEQPKIFTDSYGNQHELQPAWRRMFHPNWESMLKPQSIQIKDKEGCIQSINYWINKLLMVEKYLNFYKFSLVNKKLLEIGTDEGPTVFALAHLGALNVTGSDVSKYYIHQDQSKEVTDQNLKETFAALTLARNAYKEVLDPATGLKTSFIEDDICNSKIESNSLDGILSFEVLEHLTDPQAAFREMARILKPGGFAFHEYNPFFSVGGGHSLASADFPWGHARLNSDDFKKMISDFRPNEIEASLRFYHQCLNRMSLKELKVMATSAGLEINALIPWFNMDHLRLVTKEILDQIKNIYPDIDLNDLISPFVWIVLEKPFKKMIHVYS